ncbi:ubiquitin-protein ligase E3A isoform X2 [Chrysoperla carnea]|uniref:ubiquitin-protein ligase E3A isoform X2 n=1 Tax=Chrysoperla carnea TaxID=189513 RepID=UPI001D08D812|nr:ubiquitin-protein ligase E3A isoform X2 [Chrysoperla carnea]
MNSSENHNSQADASETLSEASGSQSPNNNSDSSLHLVPECDSMKRAAARKLIERYFYQLIDGCGNPSCDNEFCASSGEAKIKNLTPDQAAAQAIQLFSQEARLCDRAPSKVARTHDGQSSKDTDVNSSSSADNLQSSSKTNVEDNEMPDNDLVRNSSSSANSMLLSDTKDLTEALNFNKAPVEPLTEDKLNSIITQCKEENCYYTLLRTITEVFSDLKVLARSFPTQTSQSDANSPIDALLNKAPGDLSSLKKEDVRILEGENEKDEDSCCSENDPTKAGGDTTPRLPVDLESVRRAFKNLFELSATIFEQTLVTAITASTTYMHMVMQMHGTKPDCLNDMVNAVLILCEIPILGSGEFLETALPSLCRAAAQLPTSAQATLARRWAKDGKPMLKTLLESLQQLITLRVIVTHFNPDFFVQDEPIITSATKLMKIVYYANILAGKLDPPELRKEDLPPVGIEDSILMGFNHKQPKPVTPDPLAQELNVNILDSRKPFIPFAEFYNEPLSDAVEMDRDFANYKGESTGMSSKSTGKFSFMRHAFILTPATKTMGLYFDNRIRMYSERRMSFFQSMAGQPSTPYLKLKVRRDHIIDDTLVELEVIAMENPNDLKKQLVVEFAGEQGVDEGGISKEFFQLIIDELFNPDYSMFTHQIESQTVWFNPTSFESDAQFTLVGIVLGLAIYNNIILSVNFPMVVYSKLMGKQGCFDDLEDWNSVLHKGLTELLEYEGDDIEEVFMQTFKVSYQDVFGATITHELKQNGGDILVNQSNKHEFVDLYADFLLNKSVEKQYRAFHRGFQMVTDESPLQLLFRPEEIELLVCGSKNFDLNELEQATQYDAGYTKHTQIIKDFWSIVHAFPVTEQRKFLQFTTGSDRVPVGGFSKLKLLISRNGPDSDRLPTAHTCFNVLLLPEYSSKEKLYDRLVKAINYSKGFGMM